jgi:hypothetical protein
VHLVFAAVGNTLRWLAFLVLKGRRPTAADVDHGNGQTW